MKTTQPNQLSVLYGQQKPWCVGWWNSPSSKQQEKKSGAISLLSILCVFLFNNNNNSNVLNNNSECIKQKIIINCNYKNLRGTYTLG